MKNVIWIILSGTLIFNLITIAYSIENEDELDVYLKSHSSLNQETPNVSTFMKMIIVICKFYNIYFSEPND